ncbi:MAG: alpha/beta hydrolase [Segetibacter sp.]|jgi:pimeloyl-ACP methyl ester carboxylesterase|nr:alpha/beta hydrolase [Segetibacter sp.]
MQSHYISHRNSTIHYRQFGVGAKLLFCFHGYGRESFTFSFLERRLGNSFTIIAIDIPFHGLTEWKDELIFKPKYFTEFILDIRSTLKKDNAKFSLLGFSMGGRIALYLTQLLPEKVERLILIAPDGLSFNFWRWLGSETWIGSKLLHYTINHPGWLTWIINKAEKWRVIPRSLAEFVSYYIYDEEHRKTLYRRWISMRKFRPSLTKLKRLIKKNRIPVRMLFGAFDRVIPYQGGERFKQGIEEFASVEVVEAGHNLLSEVNVRKIVQLIND